MKIFRFEILLIIIFLSGCVSKEYNEAAQKTAVFWAADSYTTLISNSIDSKEGGLKTLVFIFKNIKNAKNYSHEKVTSLSAYRIIQEMNKEDYNKFDMLKIVIENDTEKFEQGYEISKLISAIPLIKNAISFFSLSNKQDYQALREIMSETEISDTIIKEALIVSRQIDQEYGKYKSIDVTGFSFNKSTEINEPLIIIWVEVKYDHAEIINYIFYVSERSEKILYFGIGV